MAKTEKQTLKLFLDKCKPYFSNQDNRNTVSQVLLVESGTIVKSNLETATTLSIILKISESR